MGFSAKQVHALRRNLDGRQVRTRAAHGRELSYIEGWFAISQANRIFGFDGWSRETVESRCVLARENRGTFIALYIAKVRITVQADGSTIIREGHGSGEEPRHFRGGGSRPCPQGRGNRCHQAGLRHIWQAVRARALPPKPDSGPGNEFKIADHPADPARISS